MTELPRYFQYWGKADPNYSDEPKWHPLVYHCLDVAASGQVLLGAQPAWHDTLARLSGQPFLLWDCDAETRLVAGETITRRDVSVSRQRWQFNVRDERRVHIVPRESL